MDNIALTNSSQHEVIKIKNAYWMWHSDFIELRELQKQGYWRANKLALLGGAAPTAFNIDVTDWQIQEDAKPGAQGVAVGKKLEGFIPKWNELLESYFNEMLRRPVVIFYEDFDDQVWILGGQTPKARVTISKAIAPRQGYNISFTNSSDETSLIINDSDYFPILSIDAMAQALYDAAEADGAPFVQPYRGRINRFFVAARAAGLLPYLKYLVVDAMIDTDVVEADRKKQVLIDMINPAIKSVFHNDYTGSHVGGIGFVGNIAGSFGILTPYNPSVLHSRNSTIVGYLCLSDTGASGSADLSAFSSGTKYTLMARPHYSNGEFIVNEGATIGSYTYQIPRAFNKQWRRAERTASGVTKEYDNGMLVAINSASSADPINALIGRFGFYDGSWVGFSSGKQGALYGGTAGLNANKLEELISYHLLRPIGKASYMNKNILAIGDSIFSSQAQGLYSAMWQETIADLNNYWTLTNLALSGEFLSTTEGIASTHITPYIRLDFEKNIAWIHEATNDVANGTPGATAYTTMKSLAQKLTTAGFTVIISGIISRKAALGVSQGAFDAEVAAYHALLLADFSVAHGTIANYWLPGTGVVFAHGFVNCGADSDFADANDTTYFNADKVHLNATGNTAYKDKFSKLIIPTL